MYDAASFKNGYTDFCDFVVVFVVIRTRLLWKKIVGGKN